MTRKKNFEFVVVVVVKMGLQMVYPFTDKDACS